MRDPFVSADAVIVSTLHHKGPRQDQVGHLGIVERAAHVEVGHLPFDGVHETEALIGAGYFSLLLAFLDHTGVMSLAVAVVLLAVVVGGILLGHLMPNPGFGYIAVALFLFEYSFFAVVLGIIILILQMWRDSNEVN